jgi:L-alanine-DL-glutamate epimerase-like enolase superfamily enzyme
VRLETDSGATGIGEIATLASHGTRTIREQLTALESIAPRLLNIDIKDLGACAAALLGEGAAYGPLRCGLETAALDALTRMAALSAATYLARDAAADVRANAVVDAAPCIEATSAAAAAVRRGFRDLKVKVGAAHDAATEASRLAAVRAAVGPDVRIRVDANGAWDERAAVERLNALGPHAVELAEQPVAAGDLRALARVREAVPMPVAADEGVTGPASIRALIAAHAVDAVVVKLPAVGGPFRAIEVASAARAGGVDVVVTSAIDSGIGIAAALHVAAALRPTRACGLATLGLLEDDLIAEALPIDAGRMPVPGAPGLGVTLDERALARYATGAERVVRA